MGWDSQQISRVLGLLEVLKVLEVVDEFLLVKIVSIRNLVQIERIGETLYELSE